MIFNILAIIVFLVAFGILAINLGASAMCNAMGFGDWLKRHGVKDEFEWQPYFWCALLALSAGRLIYAMLLA